MIPPGQPGDAVTLRPHPARIAKLLAMLRSILERSRLTDVDAERLAGKLHFLCSTLFGQLGQAALHPIYSRGAGCQDDGYGLNDTLKMSCQLGESNVRVGNTAKNVTSFPAALPTSLAHFSPNKHAKVAGKKTCFCRIFWIEVPLLPLIWGSRRPLFGRLCQDKVAPLMQRVDAVKTVRLVSGVQPGSQVYFSWPAFIFHLLPFAE